MNRMDGNVALTEEQVEVLRNVMDKMKEVFDTVMGVVDTVLDSFAEYCNDNLDKIIYYGKLELLNDFMNEHELFNDEGNMIDNEH